MNMAAIHPKKKWAAGHDKPYSNLLVRRWLAKQPHKFVMKPM
jgi:hypothetical protein